MAVALHCIDQGEGPALLVLHGLYGAGNNWGRHARAWAKRYRVLTPDLRNHGRSPHEADMGFAVMADDLLALLDDKNLHRVAVLGHSMGGKTAMALAMKAPERVAALIVADIAPVSYDHGHDEIIRALQALPLAEIGSRAEADEALEPVIESSMVRQFLLTNLVSGQDGYHWRIPLDILAEARPTLESWPDNLTGSYSGPALFVHGGASDYVEPRHHSAIHAIAPNAEITAVPGAGHWLHVEKPTAFAEVVDGFLAEHYPGG